MHAFLFAVLAFGLPDPSFKKSYKISTNYCFKINSDLEQTT